MVTSQQKAAYTRQARQLLEGWGFDPSLSSIREVAIALADEHDKAVAAERERCAVIADKVAEGAAENPWPYLEVQVESAAADQICARKIAAAIRKGEDTDGK